ncbi:Uncharacterised protein [Mycobacteroides abscessus]|nr:Uncharacterised protein [Mycobacteroides abscessus]SHV76777.1 Uncharacterised protein [Mycobacteroides abscessus subsp. abscessus]
MARTDTSGFSIHRGATALSPGMPAVCSQCRGPSVFTDSTVGTVVYRRAQRSLSASAGRLMAGCGADTFTNSRSAPLPI